MFKILQSEKCIKTGDSLCVKLYDTTFTYGSFKCPFKLLLG